MEARNWKFKYFFGEIDISKTLVQITQKFDLEAASSVQSWLNLQDGELVMQQLNPSIKAPLFLGRCFTSWDVKAGALSQKKTVLSGEFQYDTFIGKGINTPNYFGTPKTSFVCLQRVDVLYCHQCLSQHGLSSSKPIEGLKIVDGQTSSINRHIQYHNKKPTQIGGFTSVQYEKKVFCDDSI